MVKNPYIAAILNFVLYGLGYLYLGKKKQFGILLIISDLIIAYAIYANNVVSSISLNIGFALLGLSLSYDAFKEAKKKK